MDSQILYSIFGIVGFGVVIYLTMRSTPNEEHAKTKEVKREEILADYREQLRVALEPLQEDKEAMMAKKSAMLKKFSDELAVNIFFDLDEIAHIIKDLANE